MSALPGEMRDGYYQRYWHYNARGKCLLPGFVDSHTHFVFGGERAEEFSWRLKGKAICLLWSVVVAL